MTASVAPEQEAQEEQAGIRKRLGLWSDTGRSASKLWWSTVRHGVLPIGVLSVRTLMREGKTDLHWKVLGDALVRVLRKAGPLPTKVGQILATRSDLLPEPVCRRLEALYSDQPAMPKKHLEQALAEAYPDGLPFTELSPEPIGVGSVGQVHRGLLEDGRRVIVKVTRPGVERDLARDLNAARGVLALLPRLPKGDREAVELLLEPALDDLAAGFARETDLQNEAQALCEFAERFQGNKRVRVPVCYPELSSKGVLVMEELVGEPLSAYRERAKDDPQAAKRVASLALGEILRQVFQDGRFHADPHAGNLLVLEDGRLGLIDLGLTGEFTPEERKAISRAIKVLVGKKPDGAEVMRALLGLGTVPDDFDEVAFGEQVAALVADHRGRIAAYLSGEQDPDDVAANGGALERFVSDLFLLARRSRIQIPSSTTLLVKSLVTIEGVARSLDPEINVARTALPVIVKSMTPSWLSWLAFWRRD